MALVTLHGTRQQNPSSFLEHHFPTLSGLVHAQYLWLSFLPTLTYIEHTLGPGSLPSKAAAFFGFYTFFYTQTHDTAPSLFAIENVPIPLGTVAPTQFYESSLHPSLDHYLSLKMLPDSFDSEPLLPLKLPVCYILSVLFKNHIFFIVPHSDLNPLNPRTLPREIFIDGHHLLPAALNAPKKKGRPSKRDKAKKAKTALEDLDSWLDRAANTSATNVSLAIDHNHFVAAYPTGTSLARYQTEKSSLLNGINTDIQSGSLQTQSTVERANRFILERLKSANQLDSLQGLPLPSEGEELVGISRIERALEELAHPTGSNWGVGALGLLEGAGMTR